jgi:hypothetical protein
MIPCGTLIILKREEEFSINLIKVFILSFVLPSRLLDIILVFSSLDSGDKLGKYGFLEALELESSYRKER